MPSALLPPIRWMLTLKFALSLKETEVAVTLLKRWETARRADAIGDHLATGARRILIVNETQVVKIRTKPRTLLPSNARLLEEGAIRCPRES